MYKLTRSSQKTQRSNNKDYTLKEEINTKRENTIDIEHCVEKINNGATRASNLMIYNAKGSKADRKKIINDKKIVSNILNKADLNGTNILELSE